MKIEDELKTNCLHEKTVSYKSFSGVDIIKCKSCGKELK